MATFQMETRLAPKQRTNLKQRATAAASAATTATNTTAKATTATTTSRHQRQRQQTRSRQTNDRLTDSNTDPPTAAASCIPASRLLWPTTATATTSASASASASALATGSSICSSTGADGGGCQRALIMLTMLVVVIVVISGNGVFAAQRDSYKSKDMSSSNNAIPNSDDATVTSINAASAGVPSGSGNSNNNASNGGNNKNGHATSNAAAAAAGGAGGASAATAGGTAGAAPASASAPSSSAGGSSITVASNSVNGIASSSLHKANSAGIGNGINTIASAAASGVGIHRNSIELSEEARNSGPYFDKAASKNITALLGKTAYLNCRVKNLGNKTMLLQVSWVRHRDIHLLTVGRYTYTSDQRFRAIHQPQTEDWMLQIKYPQHRDSGIYECQVSTTPHMSHYIHLNVVEPSTEIIGAPDLYIESGSTINLTCVILNSPEPPAYIFWNHNNAIINYDSPRGGVSVVTNKGETTTSFLLIKSARPSDSGHYQCNPSNAKPKSVTVHVLNGEFPAAMQHAAPAHPHMSPSHYLLVYLFVCLFSSALARRSMRHLVVQSPPAGGAATATPTPTDAQHCDISLAAC